MRPSTKLQVFANFLTPKIVTTFSHPPYSPDLSPPDYVLFPKLKMKLKELNFAVVAEIKEAVTDELKKVQKEEFSAAFRNYTTAQNPVYMPVELISNRKSYVLSSFVFDLKKSVLNLLDRTVYSLTICHFIIFPYPSMS
jgi:hypothetical protein